MESGEIKRGNGKWPLIRDVGAAILGAGMLISMTAANLVFGREVSIILAVIAFACLGVTGSGIAQRWLQKKIET